MSLACFQTLVALQSKLTVALTFHWHSKMMPSDVLIAFLLWVLFVNELANTIARIVYGKLQVSTSRLSWHIHRKSHTVMVEVVSQLSQSCGKAVARL